MPKQASCVFDLGNEYLKVVVLTGQLGDICMSIEVLLPKYRTEVDDIGIFVMIYDD